MVRNNYHRWTDGDDAIIREWYPVIGSADTAAMIGDDVSVPAVQQRAKKIGVRGSMSASIKRRMSDPEYRARATAAMVAKNTGGTPWNKGKKWSLEDKRRMVRAGHHAWSESDDRIVREFYPLEGKVGVACRLGLRESQVKARARSLGVQYDYQTKWDIDCSEHPEDNDRQRALRLGVSASQVRRQRKEMGIAAIGRNKQEPPFPRYFYAHTECYERDRYTCRTCGRVLPVREDWDARLKKKAAHHIIHKKHWRKIMGNENVDSLDNMVTLCRHCHVEAHRQFNVLVEVGYSDRDPATFFLAAGVSSPCKTMFAGA